MYTIKRQEIKTRAPFDEIFPVANDTLNRVIVNMRENGFDPQEPIVVWRNRYQRICVDGHTRLMAADGLGIQDIPVLEKLFDDEDAAIEYAIHRQRDRRNLTWADLMRCVEALDRREAHGDESRFDVSIAQSGAMGERSSQKTAEIIGTSHRQVEKVRTVLDHADDETKEAVKAGEMSINKAYNATQEKRKGVVQKERDNPPVTEAMQYAAMAIANLERIRPSDPKKLTALKKVRGWCEKEMVQADSGGNHV